ncbi:hypothetical protein ACLKA6_012093 [Drosophila palustris]
MNCSPSMVEDHSAQTPSPDPTETKDEDPSKLPVIYTALLTLEPNEKNQLPIGGYQVTATFTITPTENKTGDDDNNDNSNMDNKDDNSQTSLKTSPPSSDVNLLLQFITKAHAIATVRPCKEWSLSGIRGV